MGQRSVNSYGKKVEPCIRELAIIIGDFKTYFGKNKNNLEIMKGKTRDLKEIERKYFS